MQQNQKRVNLRGQQQQGTARKAWDISLRIIIQSCGNIEEFLFAHVQGLNNLR